MSGSSVTEPRGRSLGRTLREFGVPFAVALLVWGVGQFGKTWLLINGPGIELDAIPMWSAVGDFVVYCLATVVAGVTHPRPERARMGRNAVAACAVPVVIVIGDFLSRVSAGGAGSEYPLLVLTVGATGVLAGWGINRLR